MSPNRRVFVCPRSRQRVVHDQLELRRKYRGRDRIRTLPTMVSKPMPERYLARFIGRIC
jgi:hypothetical protein